MTTTAPAPVAAPAVEGSDIKLGLTLYSLTSEWAAGRYDLPGLLDVVDAAGIGPGIEIVASQTIRSYPEVTPEFVRGWRDAFDRVCGLVERLRDVELEVTVPACPDWTARQLLAHMVGLGVDVLAGDEPDDHNSTWTQRQVDARRDRSAPDLLEEWRGVADDLVGLDARARQPPAQRRGHPRAGPARCGRCTRRAGQRRAADRPRPDGRPLRLAAGRAAADRARLAGVVVVLGRVRSPRQRSSRRPTGSTWPAR